MSKDDKLTKMYDFIRLPEGHRDCTLSGVTEAPYKRLIEDWVEHITDKVAGRGLYLYGTYGHGKSGAAAVIMKAALANGIFSLWVNFRDLTGYILDEKNHIFSDDLTMLARLKSVELLIIDEFEAKLNKVRPIEDLETILRYRHSNGLTTIITSNSSPEKIINGDVSALMAGFTSYAEEALEYVMVKGKNLRKS